MAAETKRGGIAFHWLMLLGFIVGLGFGLAANLGVSPNMPWVQWLQANVTGGVYPVEWLASITNVIGQLFLGTPDPLEVIKWKDMYDMLEDTLDQCEDVANVLESISIKNS